MNHGSWAYHSFWAQIFTTGSTAGAKRVKIAAAAAQQGCIMESTKIFPKCHQFLWVKKMLSKVQLPVTTLYFLFGISGDQRSFKKPFESSHQRKIPLPPAGPVEPAWIASSVQAPWPQGASTESCHGFGAKRPSEVERVSCLLICHVQQYRLSWCLCDLYIRC